MIPKVNVIETGKNIKKLMSEKNVTPTNIQFWCGLATVQPIYHWIHGRNLPTIDNLVILSAMFNCSIEDILVIEDCGQ